MPTSFAIASTGEIFLADGYCNSRVLKFNALGKLLKVIPSRDGKISNNKQEEKILVKKNFRISATTDPSWNNPSRIPRSNMHSRSRKYESCLSKSRSLQLAG